METFTLFPCGSSPSTTHCGINGNFPNGTSTPPADLTPSMGSPSFNAFVAALVSHTTAGGHNVRDYVKVWELQNEWNLPVHLTDCGTMTQCETLLYQLLGPVVGIIRANVPGSIIIMPSSTPAASTFKADYSGWLANENATGRISDYPNWHLYMTTKTPETMWMAYVSGPGTLLPVQHAANGWNYTGFLDTETNFLNSFTCSGIYSESDCAGQIARWQILHDSNGGVSLDWYLFSDTIANGPSTPTSYATVYQNLQSLTVGGHYTAPASSDGQTPATWSAPFHTSAGHNGVWLWTDSEAGVNYTVRASYQDYRDLLGGTHSITDSQTLPLTVVPILLED